MHEFGFVCLLSSYWREKELAYKIFVCGCGVFLGVGKFPSFKIFCFFSPGSNENQMVPGCNYLVRSIAQTLELSPAVIVAQRWFARRRKSVAS